MAPLYSNGVIGIFNLEFLLLQGKMHKRDANYLVIWLNFSSLD